MVVANPMNPISNTLMLLFRGLGSYRDTLASHLQSHGSMAHRNRQTTAGTPRARGTAPTYHRVTDTVLVDTTIAGVTLRWVRRPAPPAPWYAGGDVYDSRAEYLARLREVLG